MAVPGCEIIFVCVRLKIARGLCENEEEEEKEEEEEEEEEMSLTSATVKAYVPITHPISQSLLFVHTSH
jgi:hypothetical protein